MFCIYQEANGEEQIIAARVAKANGGSGSRARASGIRATRVVANKVASSLSSRVTIGRNPKTKVAKEKCI